MNTPTIVNRLRRIDHELKVGTFKSRDAEIAALQTYLYESKTCVFPSFVYPYLREVLNFYCREILPQLNMSPEDLQWIRQSFEDTLGRVHFLEEQAELLEKRFRTFFLNVKMGMLPSVEDIVTALWTSIVPDNQKNILNNGRGIVSEELRKYFQMLRRSSFASSELISFFTTLLSQLPSPLREMFMSTEEIFWHQLNDLLQLKAVLVNPLTKQAQLLRFDVNASLESRGIDELILDSTIDDRMRHSCWNALQAARTFLETHFPTAIRNQAIQVRCSFSNALASYSDASASLLVGVKVIGDILNLEIDPKTVISGEVDKSGKVLPVKSIDKKLEAAERHIDIHSLYLPKDRRVRKPSRLKIVAVETFNEAVKHFYGQTLQKKLRQTKRRNFLKGIFAFSAASLSPLMFSVMKDTFFTHKNPVQECDFRLLDCARMLYQQQGGYQPAITILETILERFRQEHTATEAIRLKAFALGQLGIIYLQQYRMQESLAAFRKACDLWNSINDRENMADILYRIGEVYRHTVAMDGSSQNSTTGLQYYQQAHNLLTPSMRKYTTLCSRYYTLSGYMHYWTGQGELAASLCQQGSQMLEPIETNWSYQTARQHWGRALVKVGEYDDAYDILTDAMAVSTLRGPHDRVRNYWALSELHFLTGQQEKGKEFVERAEKLCREYKLIGQHRILTHLVRRYQKCQKFSFSG